MAMAFATDSPVLMSVDRVHDPAPDLEVHPFGDLYRLVGGVFRHEPDPAVLLRVQPLDRELLPDARHDDVAVLRLHHPVHDEQLARVDARLHRIALDANVEGSERVPDEVPIEINAAGDLVLGGGREA